MDFALQDVEPQLNRLVVALVEKIPYLSCEYLLHVWRRGPVLCFVDSQPLVWVGVD